MKIPFIFWPKDRISNDTAVDALIAKAVYAETIRCANVARAWPKKLAPYAAPAYQRIRERTAGFIADDIMGVK